MKRLFATLLVAGLLPLACTERDANYTDADETREQLNNEDYSVNEDDVAPVSPTDTVSTSETDTTGAGM